MPDPVLLPVRINITLDAIPCESKAQYTLTLQASVIFTDRTVPVSCYPRVSFISPDLLMRYSQIWINGAIERSSHSMFSIELRSVMKAIAKLNKHKAKSAKEPQP